MSDEDLWVSRSPQTSWLGENDLRRAAAQMLIVGFSGALPRAPQHIEEALEEGLGGVVLFRRNVDQIDAFIELTQSIHAACPTHGPTPFVAVDQEGGRVVRLRDPLTPIPTMRSVGAVDDVNWTQEVSKIIALELSATGVNLNFAPVVDVDTNPANPVIGDRSFSRDPKAVARHGRAFVNGHLEQGVFACAKHFPGHGDTRVDSHLELPYLPHDLARLREVELHPFSTLFSDDLPMLMTAHILFEDLDRDHPATLSAKILHSLLRQELKYRGLVVTDCLEMKAVSERYKIEDMIDLGLQAGVDIFLICHTEAIWRRAWERLVTLGEQETWARKEIFSRAAHIVRRKEKVFGAIAPVRPGQEIFGCAEHRRVFARASGKNDELWNLDPTES